MPRLISKFTRLHPKNQLWLVLLATFVIHTSYIFNSFTWLDHGDIERRRTIFPLSQLHLSFVHNFGTTNFFRPLVTIANSLDYALYNHLAWGYHLTNIIFHLGFTGAVYYFLIKYFRLNHKLSLLGSLIVGIHPLSWLPVGAISYRQEILMSFFILTSLIFHTSQRQKPQSNRIFATGLFLLAFFSKETALFLLPALIVLWELKQFTANRKNYLKHISTALPLFVLEFVSLPVHFYFRLTSVPLTWDIKPAPLNFSPAIATRAVASAKQVSYLFLPLKPPLSDAIRIYQLSQPLPLLIIAAMLLSVILLLKNYRHQNLIFVVAFFLLSLAPALNFIPLPRFTSPHYSYFATVGLGALIALTYKKSFPQHFILALWITVAAISTFNSGFLFQNDKTLFAHEVKTDPHFLEGHYYLGNYYLNLGQIDQASLSYENILNSDSHYLAYFDIPSFYINLAAVRLSQGKPEEAKSFLENVISQEKDNGLAIYNLALVEWNLQNYARTRDLLEPNLDKINQTEAIILLSKTYLKLGDEAKATQILQRLKQ